MTRWINVTLFCVQVVQVHYLLSLLSLARVELLVPGSYLATLLVHSSRVEKRVHVLILAPGTRY